MRGTSAWTNLDLSGRNGINPDADGSYVGKVATPEKGFTAYLVELTYDAPGDDDLVLSSPTRVVPDVEPFKHEAKTEWRMASCQNPNSD